MFAMDIIGSHVGIITRFGYKDVNGGVTRYTQIMANENVTMSLDEVAQKLKSENKDVQNVSLGGLPALVLLQKSASKDAPNWAFKNYYIKYGTTFFEIDEVLPTPDLTDPTFSKFDQVLSTLKFIP